jgi:hypothetical protein
MTHSWRLLVEGVAENKRNKTISYLAERLLSHNVDLEIGTLSQLERGTPRQPRVARPHRCGRDALLTQNKPVRAASGHWRQVRRLEPL